MTEKIDGRNEMSNDMRKWSVRSMKLCTVFVYGLFSQTNELKQQQQRRRLWFHWFVRRMCQKIIDNHIKKFTMWYKWLYESQLGFDQ